MGSGFCADPLMDFTVCCLFDLTGTKATTEEEIKA
jgi:hypothetical protein